MICKYAENDCKYTQNNTQMSHMYIHSTYMLTQNNLCFRDVGIYQCSLEPLQLPRRRLLVHNSLGFVLTRTAGLSGKERDRERETERERKEGRERERESVCVCVIVCVCKCVQQGVCECASLCREGGRTRECESAWR